MSTVHKGAATGIKSLDADAGSLFLSVSGSIGAGKTTLCEGLGKVTGMFVQHEPVTSNPFLKDFYRDPSLYSFPAQVHFLVARFEHHKKQARVATAQQQQREMGCIQDRSLHEDGVFALVQYRRGVMEDRLYNTYRRLFDTLAAEVPLPDVILHLDVPPEICLQRIRARGRPMESGIDLDYLIELKTAYDEFFDRMAKRTVVMSIDWGEHFVDANVLWREHILPKLRTIRYQTGEHLMGQYRIDMS